MAEVKSVLDEMRVRQAMSRPVQTLAPASVEVSVGYRPFGQQGRTGREFLCQRRETVMKGSMKLFSVKGIDVKVHFTFTLILIWAAYRWGVQAGEGVTGALFGVVVTLLLFVCVTLHELAHSLTAMRYGVTVREITLLPIGGLAQMEEMPAKPAQELKMALAGPLTNIVIAVLLILICLPLGLPSTMGVGDLFQVLGNRIVFKDEDMVQQVSFQVAQGLDFCQGIVMVRLAGKGRGPELVQQVPEGQGGVQFQAHRNGMNK